MSEFGETGHVRTFPPASGDRPVSIPPRSREVHFMSAIVSVEALRDPAIRQYIRVTVRGDLGGRAIYRFADVGSGNLRMNAYLATPDGIRFALNIRSYRRGYL